MPRRIRIIGVPPGQAPKEIREAWVGLEFPVLGVDPKDSPDSEINIIAIASDDVAAVAVAGTMRSGVLGGPRENADGYDVDTNIAIGILRKKDPKAADWWDKHPLRKVMHFLTFKREVCEEI